MNDDDDLAQNICADCWGLRHPARQPTRIKDADPDQCCICGEFNTDGIYFPIDPMSVPFPHRSYHGRQVH